MFICLSLGTLPATMRAPPVTTAHRTLLNYFCFWMGKAWPLCARALATFRVDFKLAVASPCTLHVYYVNIFCFSLKALLDLLRLRHGHLFAVHGIRLHELPHGPIQRRHGQVKLHFMPWRPIPKLGCSDGLQRVPRWLLLPGGLFGLQCMPRRVRTIRFL
jgi:hypothetical protein